MSISISIALIIRHFI